MVRAGGGAGFTTNLLKNGLLNITILQFIHCMANV